MMSVRKQNTVLHHRVKKPQLFSAIVNGYKKYTVVLYEEFNMKTHQILTYY
jgi:hypothetical protein